MDTLVGQMARFIQRFNITDAPDAVVDKLRSIFLHNMAVALAGAHGEDIGVNYSNQFSTVTGAATVWLTGKKVDPQDAAFANGFLFHSRAQDDVQHGAGTHIGCICLPAAFAVAESLNSMWQDLLESVLIGYEIASAIGLEYSTLSTKRGFRSSPLYGPFASAATAARLMGLTVEETASALSLTANMCAGLNQTWLDGTDEWRFQTANSARIGIFAAMAAKSGMTASPNILEGDKGFLRAHIDGLNLDLIRERTARLGQRWLIEDVTFKPYPVCGINQAPVQTAVDLYNRPGFNPDAIAQVVLKLNPTDHDYPGIAEFGPFTGVGQTLMSAPFCVAVALLTGNVTLRDLQSFNDSRILRLMKKFKLEKDPGIPTYGCKLEVQLESGQSLTGESLIGQERFKLDWPELLKIANRLQPEMYVAPDIFQQIVNWIELTEPTSKRPVRDFIKLCVKVG